jgi:hypothetical protein
MIPFLYSSNIILPLGHFPSPIGRLVNHSAVPAAWPVLCQALLRKASAEAPRALVQLFVLVVAPQDVHLPPEDRQGYGKGGWGKKGGELDVDSRYGSVSKPCTPGEHQNSW